MMKTRFDQKILQELLLFDGSMGALLSSMGYKTDCPEKLNIQAPEVIRDVHRRYLDAGANAIITNSLGTTPIKLTHLGLADQAEALTRAAVRVAREAAGEENYVALDIGPTGEFLRPAGPHSTEDLIRAFSVPLAAGAEAGADFVLLETQTDIAECRAACLAARETGLPIAASFTFGKGGRTLTGGTPEAAALTLWAAGATVMGVNCSGGPTEMLSPLSAMRGATPLPVVVQPNAGLPMTDAQGVTRYPFTPEAMEEPMRKILDCGASAIGGCCGTTPEHIRRMKGLLAGRRAPAPVWDGLARVCSTRTVLSVKEALNALSGPVRDAEDLYDLDEDARCALIDLRGLRPEEARTLCEEAQTATRLPLAFEADGEEALRAALREYAGVALVVGPLAASDAAREYGAKADA